MGVAKPPRRRAPDERVLGLVDEDRQRRGHERNVDSLAARQSAIPRGEACEDRDRGLEPGDDVDDRDADLRRPATVLIARAGDRHEAGCCLDDEVVARALGVTPGRAIAGDGEVDEARVDRRQLVVAEAQSSQRAGSEVLDQRVRTAKQPAEDRRAIGLLEIEPDAPLVPVDSEEVGRRSRPVRFAADPRRAPASGRVPLGRLDLHDVRAQVAEKHRRVRSGEDGRAVDDAEAGQRTGWLGGHSPMVAVGGASKLRP